MTPEEQLPLLLKAFEALQKKVPPKHLFIAANQTFAVADFRRMADKDGKEVGAVLHALLDALEAREEASLRQQLADAKARIDQLESVARFARKRIVHVLAKARERRRRAIQQKLLCEVLDELRATLKESS